MGETYETENLKQQIVQKIKLVITEKQVMPAQKIWQS